MDPIARARVNAQLQQTFAEILEHEVHDPRVDGVTLTGVQVTQDLSFAKVFFSTLGDARTAQRGLEQVAGFLRRNAAQRVALRAMPQLRFEYDASLEHGQRIETLLREWHAEGDTGEGREATGEAPPGSRDQGAAGGDAEEEA